MDSIIRWFAQEWASVLASMLSNALGEQVDASAGRVVTSPPEGVCRQATLTLADGARIFVRSPELVCTTIGGKILQSAGLASGDATASTDAFLKVVRQSLSQFASKLGQSAGSAVELTNGHDAGGSPPGFRWQEVTLSCGGPLPSCAIGIAPELLAALASHERESAMATTPPPGASSSISDKQISASPVARNSSTLDLLLEVELPIGVSFGRTQMRLKEALKLTTGSIVELNRSVTDPVELIVNNCVIARGEVVVVDGNYGVRVLEILSREERLRTLF